MVIKMNKYYCIMNGCEKGNEYSEKEMVHFLQENHFELALTNIKNIHVILDRYNKGVGDVMKLEDYNVQNSL
jgi:hypothetical protein